MIGLFFAPLVIAIFMFSESLRELQEFLFEYSIPNQLSVFYNNVPQRVRPVRLGPAVDHAGPDGGRVRRGIRPAGASAT